MSMSISIVFVMWNTGTFQEYLLLRSMDVDDVDITDTEWFLS